MPNIYFKLNTGQTVFKDERLGIHLTDPGKLAAGLDYSNLDDEIYQGLISTVIVQITEAQYNAINETIPDDPPIVVPTTYLPTLNQYMPPCPTNGFIMFGYFNSQWWKITWQTIKQCLGSEAKYKLSGRVGNSAGNPVFFPAAGVNTFTDTDLIGKDKESLIVTLNGFNLYPKSYYEDQGDFVDFEWWDIDIATGEFTKNSNFATKDILTIKEI